MNEHMLVTYTVTKINVQPKYSACIGCPPAIYRKTITVSGSWDSHVTILCVYCIPDRITMTFYHHITVTTMLAVMTVCLSVNFPYE